MLIPLLIVLLLAAVYQLDLGPPQFCPLLESARLPTQGVLLAPFLQ